MKLTFEHRRAQITDAAKKLAMNGELYTFTLEQVAEMLDISRALVRYYFGSVQGLRCELIVSAINERTYPIIAQAIVSCDPLVKDIPRDLHNAALKAMAK